MMDTDGKDKSETRAEGQNVEVPIHCLVELRETPSPEFLAGIRDSINRRVLATDAIDLGWLTLGRFLRECWSIVTGLAGGQRSKGDPGHE